MTQKYLDDINTQNSEELKAWYAEQVNTLNRWAYAYYTLNRSEVPDSSYDELYKKVRAFENSNPDMISELSPTQRVGDRISPAFKKAKHTVGMISIQDMFDIVEVMKWADGHPTGTVYCCEPKYDGASLNLRYENGALVQAISRGNGEEGEDITANMPYLIGVPLAIEYKGTIEIRGEVTMFEKHLEEINVWRVENGKEVFSNTRNAASGGLRSLESRNVEAYMLHFSPYALGLNELDLETHSDEGKFVLEQGFQNWGTNRFFLSDNIEDIYAFYNLMTEQRYEYPMGLDGMVIKVNSKHLQEKLGSTNKHPKWSCAFKFPAIEKTTKLKDVVLQVGKQGNITPVAILEPVEIGGAIISRCTLHNFDEIERMDIRIGDEVAIIRSGDVIPKINFVITDSRDGSQVSVKRPTSCPSCGCEELDERQTAIRCTNISCNAKIKGVLEYAVGKKSLNIVSLGESTINELVDKNIISTVGQLWDIPLEQFLTLDGFGEKKANKIYTAIHSIVGKVEGHRVFNAFDMMNIGETASKKLVEVFGARIFAPTTSPISYDELIAVDDIGVESAKSFISFMEDNGGLVEDLFNRLNPVFKEKVVDGDSLNGLTFCITGTLSQSRDYFKNLVVANGGKVSGSVSSKTSYLLAGEKAGSKESDARGLGVKIVNEADFLAMIV